jgi:cardiolipin synthase
LLEMYLFESGQVANRFIDALIHAVERDLTVCLLLDDFGAQGLNKEDRARLISAGVNLIYYNTMRYWKLRVNLYRDHRKILIVDGQVAFVGGAGIADRFDALMHPKRFWRDTLLKIEGPNVADWQDLFVENWQRCCKPALILPKPEICIAEEGQSGRVSITRSPQYTEGKRSLLNQIRHARNRVWITTAYFVPPWRLRQALRQAARKGVDVRILLPGRYTDHSWVRHIGSHEYGRLLRHGVKIFEYQPRFSHTKMGLCDSWVIMGSSNMDRWNIHWNLEADQEIDDSAFADITAMMFQADLANSVEVNYENWCQRSLSRRFNDWFWRKVAVLL